MTATATAPAPSVPRPRSASGAGVGGGGGARGERPRSGRRTGCAAFFDVDGTLLSRSSPVTFWELWVRLAQGLGREGEFAALMEQAREGRERAELNRAYFRLFRGVPRWHLEAVGRIWFEQVRAAPDALLAAPAAALAGHRRRGDAVVLVSGSGLPWLAPLARSLGADLVLAPRQLTDGSGILTGGIDAPMIGAGKALAVRTTLSALRLDPDRCYAYGDHISDLPMLAEVGRPVAVGGLASAPGAAGWPALAAAPGPFRPVAGS
ncbi:HAD-IB family hydrolase [Kitasatospora sp. NPDC002040]|uniref:HAD family hydrolase n=1 Tax=Kitasatospora sp. NPDC002040 TaxID=3154661 RepID=UPI00331A708A